jgi:hypothetical protein
MLAGADRGRMAYDGDEVALATNLHPQDAIAVLGIVESYALDRTGQAIRPARLARRSC